MIERFNKYGICLESSSKYPLLDEIGSYYIDVAAEQIKAGKKFVFVLDNIDWDVKAHV